ncbi:MAG TPA: NADPH-dependent FMN reductase [Pseudogracilibacillus sp.]|nr:NADPH-dependent FMN reductase [Pseudogracilibacillus sp.]
MSEIILLSGSPSVTSRSEKILDFIGSTLKHEGYTDNKTSVTDIPAEDLLYGHYQSSAILKLTKQIVDAKAIVIISPVYKAAYTGALKALIDLLPQDAFKEKAVLPIMTGGSPAHLLALEYTLKPIISILKGQSLGGVYITDQQIDKESTQPIIDQDIQNRMNQQINTLMEAIEQKYIVIQ